MSNERKKVLEMLAEGKITAEDADRLLGRLGQSGPDEPEQNADRGLEMDPTVPASAGRKPLKYLRVMVDGSDGDTVNIRVPLALVRSGIKLAAVMPAEASDKLKDSGIDLSGLSGLEGEALIQALGELSVDVDSHDGDKVRIF